MSSESLDPPPTAEIASKEPEVVDPAASAGTSAPAAVSDPLPSEVVEPKPVPETTLAERLQVSMEPPVSPPTTRKERPTLVLAPWQSEDGVSECLHCKRSFNPLFLRFKHHCRICGQIFCGSCTKQTPIRQPDMPSELLTCIPCHEAELKRQEKEIRKQQQRDALRLEQEHLAELFVELQKAFETNDEPKALLLKSEIDRLKEKMVVREQARQARKEEKAKEKKKTGKGKKPGASTSTNGNGSKASASTSSTSTKKSGTGAKTAASEAKKKPLDTPETIAAKLATRYPLEPSKLINPPTDNKRKCLVLDIDYTLFDHKWQPQVRSDLRSDKTIIPLFKRPYLHEFLATCNLRYDIIIWSATGMPAIDNKVGNLGIYSSDRYKITAVLCKDHMIHVTKPRKAGRTYDETVKPLSVVWNKFPDFYSPQNTVHIDDMISNFQLNPLNGIHITPYKESSVANIPDTELQYLTKYLLLIAETEPDFTKLPHSKWKEWLIDKLWHDQLLPPSITLPPHIPDAPIDPSFLIAAEIAAKNAKKAASSSSPSQASTSISPASNTDQNNSNGSVNTNSRDINSTTIADGPGAMTTEIPKSPPNSTSPPRIGSPSPDSKSNTPLQNNGEGSPQPNGVSPSKDTGSTPLSSSPSSAPISSPKAFHVAIPNSTASPSPDKSILIGAKSESPSPAPLSPTSSEPRSWVRSAPRPLALSNSLSDIHSPSVATPPLSSSPSSPAPLTAMSSSPSNSNLPTSLSTSSIGSDSTSSEGKSIQTSPSAAIESNPPTTDTSATTPTPEP